MQTSVIGFPRIGTLRELKFASEKYFRGEISSQELLDTAKNLRKIHWTTQKNEGIDFIPSNDFSFYDTLLDTAAALGIVPRRYKELNLSGLDTYFAMARGYQGESGDVKALAMKKWFNTNYHYIVPEVEDDTVIKLSADKLLNEYKEAKELGITTKPVIAGPYTVLKLCRFTENKGIDDFLDDLTADYSTNYKEITDLKSKVEELKQSLEHYKKIEETLQNTLVMAQATAEDVKNVAKKQADQIISEAKGVAAQQVSEFDNEITMKRKELEDIKKQFDIYKAKMESLLISQLELLKDINKEDV